MVAIGKRVGVSVGKVAGLTLGRSGNPLAQYLSGIYTVNPFWLFRAGYVTETAGAISAAADASLGLYPVSQGTAANQPTLAGDKATFASNDYLFSTAAGLVSIPDARAPWSIWFIAELNGSTPAANECIAAWGNTAAAQPYALAWHSTTDKLSALRQTPAQPAITYASTANADATRALYVVQGTGGATTDTISVYKNTVLAGGAAASGTIGAETHDRFAIGALVRSTVGSFYNGSIVALGVRAGLYTAGEQTQLNNWRLAGAPAP